MYDSHSNLKLIDLTDGRLIEDFGRTSKSPVAYFQLMLVGKGGEHLFTSSNEGFKQWSVRGRALVQDFGKLLNRICATCD